MNISYLKELTLLMLAVIITLGCATACVQQGSKEMPAEAKKYLPQAQKYCADNNLMLGNYLGKTIIRAKDYEPSAGSKEPVVYEWNVTNKKSKEKFVLWVGPIMPMFPGMKPHVTLGKDRYNIKGKKVEQKEDKSEN
jgi:hypothetical protein